MMFLGYRVRFCSIACAGLFFSSGLVYALKIEPGIGVGIEHTNNVTLANDDKSGDSIAVGYVGANITEDEGPLNYNARASLNRYNYLQNSFDDSRYFNLSANADWAMIKDRFNWQISDQFFQRTLDSFDTNTPDNLQDTNVFSLGATIIFPFSARNSFTLIPNFSQYYFELQPTDNKQYSLAGNWNYKLSRLNNMGLSLSTRNIDYTQTGLLGVFVEDTRFSTLSINFSGQRPRSVYSVVLGSTSVKRDGGAKTSGFSGNLDWFLDLTSHSTFNANVSTELTDSSSLVAGGDNGLPGSNAPVTTDVIRSSVFYLVYQRDDDRLRSTIRTGYSDVDYSRSPLDQVDKILAATLDYPLTRKSTGGIYATYNNSKRIVTARVDKDVTIGGNLTYNFSRKLKGLFDLAYRERKSTTDTEAFDEFSVYVSLVYGFGEVYRPTRAATGF